MKSPFLADVVGLRFDNEDGTNRLEIFSECENGERLMLHHHPVKQDKNAVKVSRRTGQQIGFLKADLAKKIAPLLDRGDIFDAEIKEISRWMNGARCTILLMKRN